MKKRTLFIMAAVLVTCFIFGNSVKSIESSAAESGRIVALVAEILTAIGIKFDFDLLTYIIRKLAHVGEFFLQGTMLANCFELPYRKRIVYILFLGLLTACTDEYIQVFSGRGSMVQDVFIDFGGTAAATAAVGFIHWIKGVRKCRT